MVLIVKCSKHRDKIKLKAKQLIIHKFIKSFLVLHSSNTSCLNYKVTTNGNIYKGFNHDKNMSAHSIRQLEKNTSTSFGYVKKDLLMVNDSLSSLYDKIQHLSLNHAMLLEKMMKIEEKLAPKQKV